MTIHRLLLLAGVLAIGACQAPSGPLASCSFAGDKSEFATTAYQVCPEITPVIDVAPLGEDLPDVPAASAHR
jgi:hypothetical protein